jgi:chromosome segregation ATPase
MMETFEIIPFLNKVSTLEQKLKVAQQKNVEYATQIFSIQNLNRNFVEVFKMLNQVHSYMTLMSTPEPVQQKLQQVKNMLDSGFYDYVTTYEVLMNTLFNANQPSLDQKFQDVLQELIAVKRNNQEVRSKLENTINEKIELENTLNKEMIKSEELQALLEEKKFALRETKQDVQQRLAQKQQEIENNQAQVVAYQTQILTLDGQVQQLQAEKSVAEQNLRACMSNLSADQQALQAQIVAAETKVSEKEAQIAQAQAVVEAERANVGNAQAAIRQLQAQLAETEARVGRRDSSIASIQQSLQDERNAQAASLQQIAAKEAEIAVLQAEQGRLTQQIAACHSNVQANVVALQQEVRQKDEEIAQTQRALENAQRALEAAQTSATQVQSQLSAKQAEIAGIQQSLQDVQTAQTASLQSILAKESEIAQLQTEQSRLLQQVADCNTNVQASLSDTQRDITQKNELIAQKEALIRQKDELIAQKEIVIETEKAEVRASQTLINDLRAQLATSQAESSQLAQQVAACTNNATSAQSDTQRDIAQKNAVIAETQGKLDAEKALLVQAQTLISGLEAQLIANQNIVNARDSTIANLERNIQAAQENFDRQMANKDTDLRLITSERDNLLQFQTNYLNSMRQNAEKDTQLQQKEAQLTQAQAEIINVTTQLASKQAEVTGLETASRTQLAQKDSQLAELRTQVDDLRSQIAVLNNLGSNLTASQNEILQKNAMITQTQAALDAERAALTTSNERIVELQRNLQQLNDAKVAIEQQRDTCLQNAANRQTDLQQLQQELATKVATIAQTEQQLQAELANKAAATQAYQQLQATMQTLQAQANTCQGTVRTMQAQLAQKEEKIEKLKDQVEEYKELHKESYETSRRSQQTIGNITQMIQETKQEHEQELENLKRVHRQQVGTLENKVEEQKQICQSTVDVERQRHRAEINQLQVVHQENQERERRMVAQRFQTMSSEHQSKIAEESQRRAEESQRHAEEIQRLNEQCESKNQLNKQQLVQQYDGILAQKIAEKEQEHQRLLFVEQGKTQEAERKVAELQQLVDNQTLPVDKQFDMPLVQQLLADKANLEGQLANYVLQTSNTRSFCVTRLRYIVYMLLLRNIEYKIISPKSATPEGQRQLHKISVLIFSLWSTLCWLMPLFRTDLQENCEVALLLKTIQPYIADPLKLGLQGLEELPQLNVLLQDTQYSDKMEQKISFLYTCFTRQRAEQCLRFWNDDFVPEPLSNDILFFKILINIPDVENPLASYLVFKANFYLYKDVFLKVNTANSVILNQIQTKLQTKYKNLLVYLYTTFNNDQASAQLDFLFNTMKTQMTTWPPLQQFSLILQFQQLVESNNFLKNIITPDLQGNIERTLQAINGKRKATNILRQPYTSSYEEVLQLTKSIRTVFINEMRQLHIKFQDFVANIDFDKLLNDLSDIYDYNSSLEFPCVQLNDIYQGFVNYTYALYIYHKREPSPRR